MEFKIFAKDYIRNLTNLLNFIDLDEYEKFFNTILSIENDSTIYVLGNGGSSAAASHMVNDLAIGLKIRDIKTINAISLSDNSAINFAIANDIGFENVFYMQLKGILKPNDIIIAISCSGNSPNIVKAVKYAKEIGSKVIGLTGFDGGDLIKLSDIKIHFETNKGEYGLVEDAHSIVNHLLIDYFKKGIYEKRV